MGQDDCIENYRDYDSTRREEEKWGLWENKSSITKR